MASAVRYTASSIQNRQVDTALTQHCARRCSLTRTLLPRGEAPTGRSPHRAKLVWRHVMTSSVVGSQQRSRRAPTITGDSRLVAVDQSALPIRMRIQIQPMTPHFPAGRICGTDATAVRICRRNVVEMHSSCAVIRL